MADYIKVNWDGPDDPSNPKNWSSKKRWTATLLVSFFASIYPIGSTMISPCILTISQELHINNSFLQQLCLSIFLLGIGVGPLILAPLSEVYGRVLILYAGTCFYLVWNTACGFSKNQQQLIAFRFFSGFGASAALSVGSGVMSDLWKPEDRGKAIALYVLGPLLAPAFGPIAGAYITQGASWRWVFWGMSIATITTQTVAALFLRETYAPRILRRKVAEKRKCTQENQWHSEYDEPGRTVTRLVTTSLVRPFRLLGTHPIIQILAVYVLFFYGVLYIMIFTFPLLWTKQYHQALGSSSLNYISTGIGYVAGSQSRLHRYLGYAAYDTKLFHSCRPYQ
jgi:multidrug resistance protein